MYLDRCTIIDNHKKDSFSIHNADNLTLSFHDQIEINIEYMGSNIQIKLLNKSEEEVNINRLAFRIRGVDINEFEKVIINPEKSNEKIYEEEIKSKDLDGTESNLFTTFLSGEEFSNLFIGFLGCRSSRNYFNVKGNKNDWELYAVYDFTNHVLGPGVEFQLDTIYLDNNNNYIKLIDNYAKQMSNNESISRQSLIANKGGESLIFTSEPTSFSLQYHGNPICIIMNNKKQYLIDFTMEEGKKHIFDVVYNLLAAGENVINLSSIGKYIQQVQKYNLFNVYYEINKLLEVLYERHKDIKISVDDCPLGLIAGRMAILNQIISLEQDKKSFLQKLKLSPSDNKIHYDFIIRLILQKFTNAHKTKFITKNKKAEELLHVITGSIESIEINKRELFDVQEDIEDTLSLVPYLCKKEVLGFYVRGKSHSYIAVFNMSEKQSKFFWDFSRAALDEKIDGNAIEVYSNKSIIISDNTVYIRSIRPGDCLLIKKAM